MGHNIFAPYDVQWLFFTSGHTSQDKIFGDNVFWNNQDRRWFESGTPFKDFDTKVGAVSNISALDTAPASGRLLDHAATRTPRAEIGGLKFGPESLVDLPRLHLDWYAWTMQGGPKPAFLQKPVAYYVMGAERWRYADTLEGITSRSQPYFLDSNSNAADVLASGGLGAQAGGGKPDRYVYDPRDLSFAADEVNSDSEDLTDQRADYARRGKLLVYHSAPFEKDTEISGFFTLSAWIGIDQPDTDFTASISEIRPDGRSIALTGDSMRARYRESPREPKLVTTHAPQRYDFEPFSFVSRQVGRGSRLRLTIAINSMFSEKNYNAPKPVAEQSMSDARTVMVTLFHDRAHPSALYVPLGQP
jgi:uncharacterized protein